NFFYDPVEAFFHFVVSEPQLDKAMCFNKGPTHHISFDLIEMLFAINLDRQAEVVATKVCDEAGDRHLSAEFQSVEPAVAQLLPKHVFGRRAAGTQTSCNRGQSSSHHMQFARADRR